MLRTLLLTTLLSAACGGGAALDLTAPIGLDVAVNNAYSKATIKTALTAGLSQLGGVGVVSDAATGQVIKVISDPGCECRGCTWRTVAYWVGYTDATQPYTIAVCDMLHKQLDGIVRHELGHLLASNPNHLPPGNVMSAALSPSMPPAYTNDDLAYIFD